MFSGCSRNSAAEELGEGKEDMEVPVQKEEVRLEPERPRVIWKIGPLAQV